ncbi:hypothetical protein FQA39_LY12507 [Lamprigera yunnana]|nr:hypothetical protein FQA39_LY12507 [Lamprigera yunnana]
MYDVAEKVALVTGGAAGIGYAIAEAFLQNHLKGVAIVDIDEEAGVRAETSLSRKYSDRVIFIKTDVSERTQFDDAFKETVKKFKNLDIVVNCAGLLDENDWEREIAVNLTGTVNGTRLSFDEYLPKFMSGNEGVIINVSSTLALGWSSSVPIYIGTKIGVIGLSRSFGTEANYERSKVKVIAVCPGYADTLIHKKYVNNFPSQFHLELFKKETSVETYQTADHVAKCTINIIKTGKNGSVWVIKNNTEGYEYKNVQ